MSHSNHVQVGGSPEGFDAKLILNEVTKSGAPVIHIARDDKRMAAMAAAAAAEVGET